MAFGKHSRHSFHLQVRQHQKIVFMEEKQGKQTYYPLSQLLKLFDRKEKQEK